MRASVPTLIRLFIILITGMAAVEASAAAAQTPSPKLVAHFKGTGVNLVRVNGETVTIDVRRWSTDEERDRMLAAFAQGGAAQAAEVLKKADSAGYLWRSGSGLGVFVKYAHETKLPDGRQRVILVTEQSLTEWNRRPGPAPNAPEPPLTLIELRLPPKGAGEGKLSLATPIAADTAAKTLALENYDAAPVAFRGVTRDDSAR